MPNAEPEFLLRFFGRNVEGLYCVGFKQVRGHMIALLGTGRTVQAAMRDLTTQVLAHPARVQFAVLVDEVDSTDVGTVP